MKMKHRLLMTAAAAALLFTTACSDQQVITPHEEQVNITLSWWGNDQRNEYTIAAVKLFEKLHPEIKVKCNYSEWSGYQARSDVQMVSGTEADVMQINYAWIEQYSPDGKGFYDIQQLSDHVDLSNFTEDELSYGMQEGSLNAVPIALNTQSVYINKTIYDRYGLDVPQTWEDFFDAAKVMYGEVYPVAMTSKSSWFFITAYAEQVCGKQFMTMNGELNFEAEDIQVMLEFYRRLIEEKVMPQVEYFERLAPEDGIYAGIVAWLSDGSSYCDRAVRNGYEYIVTDYPADAASKVGDGWYAKPATMYAISKNTDHPEESAMLLDFLLNSTEMADLQRIEKGIPLSDAAQTYLAESDLLNGMQYQAFEKMSEYSEDLAVISPYFENEELIAAFRDASNAVLYDKADSAEKAEELRNTFAEILAEARG
ncbi:MAG: carbohydrate ABC transporter substrate-binding protein [Oscillospiraceae bacterium]|nr:carbohydrate ABC transporter substrate-binding protein [Oscillospiraceae bacterium]